MQARTVPSGQIAQPDVRYVDGPRAFSKTFSVCTILHRQENYDRLLRSFARLGFSAQNTEFLAFDNRDENRFDGFRFVRQGVSEAQGQYVVFCHDDIELVDLGFDDLKIRLEDLEKIDPVWSIAGVAGGQYRPQEAILANLAYHVSDRHGSDRQSQDVFPRRAETLDECFFVMPAIRAAVPSLDLAGFHFFATDLCLQAEILGGRAYVISFLLHHHGRGSRGLAYRQQRRRFSSKYRRYFPGRTLLATTGPIPLG